MDNKIKKLKSLLEIHYKSKEENLSLQEEIEELLLNILPHGSGIDYDWRFIWHKNGNIDCLNAYHAMTECGMYWGAIPFKVKFFQHKKDVINLVGDKAQIITLKLDIDYKIYAPNCHHASYGPQDYLEDTIGYTLEGIRPPIINAINNQSNKKDNES